jgi:hypothetical protein
MMRLLEALRHQLIDLLRALASRPGSLFCLLLAANALALPYRNFVHDANLYGVQVLNRVYPGHFAGDLYFQYGSQDRYSAFSIMAAPLVARLGLPAGFFLLYLASNALFLFALQRFVRAIIKDPVISTLALLFMALTEIPFGGLRIFHVNEPFLTPRIAANALVLLSLERLIAGRVLTATALVLMALPLHPLMAFPGVLILAVWLGLTRLRLKWFLALLSLAALAAAAFLNDRPLASRWFGIMDDAWRDSVHRVNPYHFPLDWTADDWLRIVLSFVVALGAIRHFYDNAPVRRLLIAMSGVAAVGLLGGILACFLPYALPLQGQPYRCLWPLELSLYPLGFLSVQRLWASWQPAGRLAALGLLGYLNDTIWDSPVLMVLLSCAAVLGILLWRGTSRQSRVPDWPVCAAAFALALALPLWTVLKLGLIVALRQQLASLLEPFEILTLLTSLIDPLCRLALLVGSLLLLARFAAPGWRLIAACSGTYLTACLVFFVLPQSRYYSDHYTLHSADECFVAEYLACDPTSEATPTIYWPCRKIALVWFQLRANIYFEWPHQIAGNLFGARTAREGARRSQLVKKFELERLRKERILYGPRQLTQYLTVYQATENEPVPEVDDLLELCREKQLDFAVLSQEFPGLYAASNGRVFIYDCRAIRAIQPPSAH